MSTVRRGGAWLTSGTSGPLQQQTISTPAPAPTPATTPAPLAPNITYVTYNQPTPPVVAGIEPQALEAVLYNKDIPMFAGGKMMVGGRIIEGPVFGGTQAVPDVSFVAYHAMNIVGGAYADTQITSARLRGQEVWNVTSGYIATDKFLPGMLQWRPGHVDQEPYFWSIDRFKDKAIPYTFGITTLWQMIPLRAFAGIVPFPSVMVENSTHGDPSNGIPRSEAIKNVLRQMRLQDFEFEVDVSGSDSAWMVATNMSLTQFLQQLRQIFTTYQITYSDKLRIIEPSQFTVNGHLTNSNVKRGSLQFRRTDPMTLTREKRYTFIDVDRDYEMNTAVAREDYFPIPTTDATQSASIELPIATTGEEAVADIHTSLYQELKVRSQMEATIDRTLFGLECGDVVRFADNDVIDMQVRIMDAVHDFESWTVKAKGGEVLHCDLVHDPFIIYVVLLLGFNGPDGSTVFIDESPAEHGAATPVGTTSLSRSDPIFGTGSLYLDAIGDVQGIFYEDDADWQLSSSNSDQFCVECFVTTRTTMPTDSTIIGVWGGGSPVTSWMIYVNTTGGGELTFLAEQADGSPWSAVPVSSGLTWETETRYYIRVDKDATGKVRLYRGTSGTAAMIGSATPTDSSISRDVGSSQAVLSIGCNSSGGGRTWPGKIDEVRITKGMSRDASDAGVPVPATAFPRV